MTEEADAQTAPVDAEPEAGAPAEAEAPTGSPAAAEPAAPGEDAAEARRALEDRYLRLAADFDNFRKRTAAELEARSRYASEEAARALLPVLDSLRRAVEHAPEAGTEDFFVSGLHLVVREFETALERLGVTPVPSVGEPFDPAIHQAVHGEESPDVDRDTVVAELLPGYRLHDRLLRPAMVRVAHPVRSEYTET
jgi:molecular chaperone GrpE